MPLDWRPVLSPPLAVSVLLRTFLLSFLFLTTLAGRTATVREQEIQECRPGEIVTWNDGRDRTAVSPVLRFAYRHDGAPIWLLPEDVQPLVAKAVQAWAGCGIPVSLVSPREFDPRRGDTVLIQWSETGSGGNVGQADLTRRTLTLGPQVFTQLRRANPGYDTRQTLQMTLSHEMGHFFGLVAHSRRCVDVLSYYNDGKGQRCLTRDPAGISSVPEYRASLPTACDIQRCRIANGLAR